MNIVFVILHYMAVDDTIECIDSITNNINKDNIDINIIVVDNNSPDDSFFILKNKYGNNKSIILIHNDTNLGFAKGNNIGFMYAKKHFKSDFICLINNDTIIEQDDFCHKIIEDYYNLDFDIAGPSIVSLKDTLNQNPIPYRNRTQNQVLREINKYKLLKFLSTFNGDIIVHKIKKCFNKHKTKEQSENDYKLHGSALLFSRKYIDKYDGLYPKTFMYGEEDILKYISIRDGLKMCYLENIKIIHKEDSSTDKVFSNKKAKRKFYYKCSIDSLQVLLELMKGK